ncbi:MAG TPA: ATPase, T2SS/T4P/T4SS family, partial [Acidimicrobiales bacterium]|nr:ATPase, T2SS/T4P/T4SS family [Acidimicrobiales bacterium]
MSTTEQTRGGRVAPSKAEIDEARALSREVGLEYVDLDRYPLNAAAASLLPEQLARRHHALAVGWKYGTPVVAVASPDNVLAMDDVRTVVGRDIHAVVACASQIDAYIERMYNQAGGPASARPAAPQKPAGAAAASPAAPAPAAPKAAAPPAPPAPEAPQPAAKAAAAAAAAVPAPAAPTAPPAPKAPETSPKAEAAVAPTVEETATPKVEEAAATSAPEVEAAAPKVEEAAATSAPEVEAVPAAPKVEAAAAAAAAPKVEAAAAPKVEAAPSKIEAAAVTNVPKVEAAAAAAPKVDVAVGAKADESAPKAAVAASAPAPAPVAAAAPDAKATAALPAPPAPPAPAPPAPAPPPAPATQAAPVPPAPPAPPAPPPPSRARRPEASIPSPPAPPVPTQDAPPRSSAVESTAERPPEFLSETDELHNFGDAPLTAEGEDHGKGSDEPALAKVLVESGQVTPEEMQAALREASATGRKLGEILSELGLVTEEDLIRAMAEEVGLEFIDLNEFTIDLKALQSIPEVMARRHQVIAIGYRNGVPIIAMANPSNVFAMDDLRTVLGRDIVTVVSSPRQINDYVTRMYRHDKEASEAATKAAQNQTQQQTATEKVELTDLHAVAEDAPIVKYVNLILRQALQERASDVHIEPAVDDLRIRFRIDGVLHDITRSPKAIQGGVTTRLKVMANLDIAEHRLPQDGRISLNAGNRSIDLRVAT